MKIGSGKIHFRWRKWKSVAGIGAHENTLRVAAEGVLWGRQHTYCSTRTRAAQLSIAHWTTLHVWAVGAALGCVLLALRCCYR